MIFERTNRIICKAITFILGYRTTVWTLLAVYLGNGVGDAIFVRPRYRCSSLDCHVGRAKGKILYGDAT